MMWLVKFADNWADEFDVEGFTVLTQEEYTHFMDLVQDVAKKIDSGEIFSFYFGTNEWFDYESGDEFISAFESELIGNGQADTLKRFVIGNDFDRYGIFPSGEGLSYFLEGVE